MKVGNVLKLLLLILLPLVALPAVLAGSPIRPVLIAIGVILLLGLGVSTAAKRLIRSVQHLAGKKEDPAGQIPTPPPDAPAWVAPKPFINVLNDLGIGLLLLVVFPLMLMFSAAVASVSKGRQPTDLYVTFDLTNMLVDLGVLLVYLFYFRRYAGKMKAIPLLSWFVQRFIKMEEFYREHPPLPTLGYLFYPILLLFSKVRRQEASFFFGVSVGAFLAALPFKFPEFYRVYRPLILAHDFSSLTTVLLVSALLSFICNTLVLLLFFLPLNATFIRYYFEGRTRQITSMLQILAIIGGLGLLIAFTLS